MIIAYLYSAGTQHGNLPPAGWPILFCGPTQEPCVSHSQYRKNRERFWKKCRWMDWKCRNKQEKKKSLAVSVACMAIYWPTPGFKGRTFKLCVLTRWDFNFCVRSSPLRVIQGLSCRNRQTGNIWHNRRHGYGTMDKQELRNNAASLDALNTKVGLHKLGFSISLHPNRATHTNTHTQTHTHIQTHTHTNTHTHTHTHTQTHTHTHTHTLILFLSGTW